MYELSDHGFYLPNDREIQIDATLYQEHRSVVVWAGELRVPTVLLDIRKQMCLVTLSIKIYIYVKAMYITLYNIMVYSK